MENKRKKELCQSFIFTSWITAIYRLQISALVSEIIEIIEFDNWVWWWRRTLNPKLHQVYRAILANLQRELLKLDKLIVLQITNTSTAIKNIFLCQLMFFQSLQPDLFILVIFSTEQWKHWRRPQTRPNIIMYFAYYIMQMRHARGGQKSRWGLEPIKLPR